MHLVRGRRKLTSSDGFTLLELLVVLVIVGILLGVAIPAYAGMRDRGNRRAAEADIREALPTVAAFYADNGTYVGLGNKPKKTPPGITSYDPAIKAAVATGKGKPTATTFCLTATVGSATVSYSGPAAHAWYQTATCTGTASQSAP